MITNGGFETGNLSGWDGGGTLSVESGSSGSAFVHSGSYGTTFGAASISQAFITTPGHKYSASFWMHNIPGGETGFAVVKWGNFDIPANLDLGSLALIDTIYHPEDSALLESGDWKKLTYSVLALGNVSSLTFEFQTQNVTYPNNLGLDDVSVTALPGFIAVPDLSLIAKSIGEPSYQLARREPFLLDSSISFTPVPEPSAYGLMGAAALIGCTFWRRTKQPRAV